MRHCGQATLDSVFEAVMGSLPTYALDRTGNFVVQSLLSRPRSLEQRQAAVAAVRPLLRPLLDKVHWCGLPCRPLLAAPPPPLLTHTSLPLMRAFPCWFPVSLLPHTTGAVVAAPAAAASLKCGHCCWCRGRCCLYCCSSCTKCFRKVSRVSCLGVLEH